jgi:hypothetical protein
MLDGLLLLQSSPLCPVNVPQTSLQLKDMSESQYEPDGWYFVTTQLKEICLLSYHRAISAMMLQTEHQEIYFR